MTDPPHVGVLLDNVPEYLFLLGGAALAGAVVVGINPTRRGAELARDIRHTDCQVIVTDSSYAQLLDGLDLGAASGPRDRRRLTRARSRARPATAGPTHPRSRAVAGRRRPAAA